MSQPSDFDAFRTQALTLLEEAASFLSTNEASTEMELSRPLFKLLGWSHFLPQQGSYHKRDTLGHLLFGDADSKAHAINNLAAARYPDAESKRFGLPLDAREGRQTGSPHAQLLSCLATADINIDGRICRGILTNGRCAQTRASGKQGAGLEARVNERGLYT